MGAVVTEASFSWTGRISRSGFSGMSQNAVYIRFCLECSNHLHRGIHISVEEHSRKFFKSMSSRSSLGADVWVNSLNFEIGREVVSR